MLDILQLLMLCCWMANAFPVDSYNRTLLDDPDDTGELTGGWTSPDYFPTPQGGRIPGVWQDAYAKAKQLVSQMTIVEKVNLTTGIGWEYGNCVGNSGSVPRFGIPNICYQDGPLGIRFADLITDFPSGLAAGTSWNRDLIYDRGKAIGYQNKQKGIHVSLGPVVGPTGLKANGGRNFEGFASDPYLAGQAVGKSVEGLQSQKVLACVKHLVGNEQERYRKPDDVDPRTGTKNKESTSANIPDRAMHEIYLKPFADAIHSGVGSIMCSYQRVNNTYSCENSYLLNYLVKEELGFPGFIVSDWAAQMSGVKSALGGLDVTMPGETNTGWDTGEAFWGQNLTKAVYNHTVPIERLDDMAARVLAAFYYIDFLPQAGDFPNFSSWTTKDYGNEFFLDKDSPVVKLNYHVDPITDFTEEIALQSAEEGIVLLKNERNALPITKDKYKKVLLAGVAAGPDPLGFEYTDQGSANGTLFQGWGSGSVTPRYDVTPFEEISYNSRKNRMQFDYIRESLPQVEKIAADAHIVIVVVSSDSGEGYIIVDGNEGDRNNLTVWHNGEELIKTAASTNNNTVVVVTSTGPVDFEKFADHDNVTAILWSGPLGQNTGTAIANVLFGKTNPSGHLPFTVAKNVNDYVLVDFDNPPNGEPQDDAFATTDLLLDYRYFNSKNITARYPLGYGLSYNKFEYCNLQVSLVGNIPSELPEPPAYLPEIAYGNESSVNSPKDALWPEDHRRVPFLLYPYLDANTSIYDGNYTFPKNYSTTQRSTPVRAGGGLGGNDALWEKVVQVTVDVKNLGSSTDKFVPQLYIKHPSNGKFETPVALSGFDKVQVPCQGKETATFDVLLRDIAVWDTTQQSWVVEHGCYEFLVGTDASTYVLSQAVNL